MTRLFSYLAVAALAAALAAGLPAAAGDATAPATPAKSKTDEKEPFKRLKVKEVEQRLGQPNVHIYDGNSQETYEKGHVPGAVNLHSKDITDGILPADQEATLIFYCQNTL